MTDEQLNAILHKADDDLDRLKDRCHDLYEENGRLRETNKILEENWLAYMKINQEAIEYINKNFVDGEGMICINTGGHTCDVNYNFLDDLLNILNGSDN